MNQQRARRGHEDDWWRQLYGDGEGGGQAAAGGVAGRAGVRTAGPSDAGPSDAPDTLDDRVESALRAVRAPAEPKPWEPPVRPAAPPPAPSTPIPLPATGPASRDTAPDTATGTPSDTAPDTATGTPSDTAPDTATGTPSDTAPDTATGTAPDTAPDTATGTATGTAPDTATDTAPDTATGTPSDTAPDTAPDTATGTPSDTPPGTRPDTAPDTPPSRTAGFVGDRPPTYDPEPGALPAADPGALDDLVPDTALDGARYGSLTLRAASQRGDSARYRGEVRRDALLTARFGAGRQALILVAVATPPPAAAGAHRAARDACAWIGDAVGRSYTQLAEDIRTDHRDALKSGLQRLTDRSYGKLRGRARELGAAPERYTAALRCLLLPADPDCRTRVFFGVGAGGLFRLRDGAWQDLEPATADHDTGDAPGCDGGPPRSAPGLAHGPYTAESPARPAPFLFRAAFARPGDTLLLCSAGLAEPLQEEPDFAARLAARWKADEPPGLVDFLAAAQLRVKGHTKDRTAVGVWEA
ncbi:protein phosphatase 2C domain-containing protein [Streptomyces inhibens]|uniref:protein phosphatase 2C domain-containing protein n=1 Tax=Streptomyces inhibens TaxID=2293571 RepID=UPI001EE6F239|nr:protein phosphatase 2C domain-containing protein [Streptomyces inhibens]UKY53484.1 protein phosphatase 2C domain-containing protein [Streptomyces inhibens]